MTRDHHIESLKYSTKSMLESFLLLTIVLFRVFIAIAILHIHAEISRQIRRYFVTHDITYQTTQLRITKEK